jgi:hypothetical protein
LETRALVQSKALLGTEPDAKSQFPKKVAMLQKQIRACTMAALNALPHTKKLILAACMLHVGVFRAKEKLNACQQTTIMFSRTLKRRKTSTRP